MAMKEGKKRGWNELNDSMQKYSISLMEEILSFIDAVLLRVE